MPSGDLAVCTLMACDPRNHKKRSVDPAIPINSPGFKCTPGEQFMNDCNKCFCLPTGTAAGCTMMACPPKQKRSVENSPVNSEGRCVPGTSFKKDCNTCFCTGN